MSAITMQSSASAVDGYVTGGGIYDLTWAQLVEATSASATTGGAGFSMMLQADPDTNDRWYLLRRGIFLFDPAPLPAGAIITGGSISFYCNATTSRQFGSSFVLTNAPVASYTAISASDYHSLWDTPVEHGTERVLLSSLTAGQRFSFTLNAQALTTFQSLYDSGNVFELGLRFDWDFDDVMPTWSAGGLDDITVMQVAGGSTKWPILTINYRVGMGHATVSLTGTLGNSGDTVTADMWAVEVFT